MESATASPLSDAVDDAGELHGAAGLPDEEEVVPHAAELEAVAVLELAEELARLALAHAVGVLEGDVGDAAALDVLRHHAERLAALDHGVRDDLRGPGDAVVRDRLSADLHRALVAREA